MIEITGINKAIINILDLENGKLILNDFKLALDQKNYEYISGLLKKVTKDKNLKKYSFKDNNAPVKDVVRKYFKKLYSFNELAAEVTSYLFEIMEFYEHDSFDLATIEVKTELGEAIAFIKIDYMEEISHIIKNNDENKVSISLSMNNSLSKNKTKCAAILLNCGEEIELYVIDKEQIKIESEEDDKVNFFTRDFLQCELIETNKEHTETFLSCCEAFIRKFIEKPYTSYRVRNFITNELITKKEIDLYKIADSLPCEEDIKQSFKVFIVSKVPEKFDIFKGSLEAKEKVNLNLNGELKLSLDRSVYNNKDSLEFIKNNDGSFNIIIKNIKEYTEN